MVSTLLITRSSDLVITFRLMHATGYDIFTTETIPCIHYYNLWFWNLVSMFYAL